GLTRAEAEERDGISRLLEASAVYYASMLRKPVGEPIRGYLRRRGISEESERRFRLGFALDSWSALATAARRRSVPADRLVRSGLAIRREDSSAGSYDRFRNRLMFPILDPLSRVIGFGARALDDTPPKYLNTSETALFSKGRVLYGLDQAKGAILEKRVAVIVEGYTDVILAHQAGVRNVVATLGTALTRDHARVLRRYADRVLVVYDGDDAGISAAGRGVLVLLEEGCDVGLVTP